MKQTLLNASGNVLRTKKTTSFLNLLLLLLVFLGCNLQNANAQCIGPFEKFQSVDSDANMNALGWTKNLFVVSSTTSGARSGTRSFLFSNGTTGPATVAYLETETLTNPNVFSFWIRRNSGTNVLGYKVELKNGATYYDMSNSTDLATLGMTPANVSMPALTANTTYYKVTVSVPAALTNIKFRISDTRALNPATVLSGAINLDDFSWTNHTASLNAVVIPELGAAVVCTPVIVPATGFLTFYDQGGVQDTYNKGQSQTITFQPAIATDKVKITFINTAILPNQLSPIVAADVINVYDGATTGSPLLLTNYTSTSTNPTPDFYTSTDASGRITIKFDSPSKTAATLNGFEIRVECLPCPAPTTLAFANGNGLSHESAYLTWSAASGVTNYDIYHSTSNTAPTSGTTPTFTSGTTTGTVTGLSGSTLYYFWVRSNCGGSSTSTWLGPISSTTLCTPQSIVYLENFNGLVGGVLPTCTRTDGAFASNNLNGNIFTNQAGDSFYSQGVTLTAGTLYRISYDYSTNLNGEASLELFIGHPTNNVAATPGNINQAIAYNGSFSVINSNIVNYTPSVSGTYYLRFYADDIVDYPSSLPFSTQLNLDNIRIELETCLPPTALVVAGGSVNDFGATLSWTAPTTGAPSNGYAYFISTTNTPPSYNDVGTGTVASNGITFSTLSPNTTYYVWVRANCGGQISIWSTGFATFTTTNISAPVTIRISDVAGLTNVTCGQNITFTDSGGTAASYANNERTGAPTYDPYSYTFVPTTPGAKLMVIFNSFATENNWDGLMIYSGQSAAGTLMPSGRAAGFLPQTCPADAWSGTLSPGSILSTAADGSLTFQFRSDSSVLGAGWTASIVCISNVPTITSFTPTTNNCTAGVSVVITGTNFTGITSVTFGGVAATYVVNSTTQITATLPATATSGRIRISTAQLSVTSATDFTVLGPPPTTTGASICTGGVGTISSSTNCNGYSNATNSLAGSWTVGVDPVAPKPFGSANSTTCGFTTTNLTYSTINFQVSVTGTYVLEMTSGVDAMGYITTGPFTAGSCATGTFIIGDDDSGLGLEPRLTVTLTAGVTYTLYSTFYFTAVSGPYSWAVTPPSGGSALLFANQSIQWYTAASGGTPIGSGSPFNPVGVAGSGLANTNTPGTTTFYAACSSNPTCRTATNFVIGGAVGGTASSSQSICGGSFADVTLAGNTGTIQWQYADDNAFTVNLNNVSGATATTLTAAQIGSFTGVRYYRAEVTLSGCSSVSSTVITLSNSKAIWNGASWSNGTGPTLTIGADFQGNYTSTGNLSACSVTVTSGNVIIAGGHTLTVQNQVNVVGGSLAFADDASLYQITDVANAPGIYSGGNTGNITYDRTAAAMFRYDYTYWSTPVSPQTLLALSPSSPTSLAYEYDAVVNNWAYFNPTNFMQVGKGYIFRAPIFFNLPPGTPLAHTAQFIGVPNNGIITLPVVGGANQMNLLGNPFASALDADDFIGANPNINGTLYFWTHNTQSTAPYVYNPSDYALYNLGGGIAAGAIGSGNNNPPNKFIASGQGFFVKGLTTGTATFNNGMREAGNNTNFYRNASSTDTDNELEKHRYWLNMTSGSSAFKQLLVGYIETATDNMDRLFDGEMVDSGNIIGLYTLVEDKKLSIQGRALPFDINETLPLGYKCEVAASFTISLSSFDGLFTSQTIYLEDTLLGVIHDLKLSPYTFVSEIGTFNTRFILRYTTQALGTNDPVFNENTVVVYQNQNGLHINSGTQNMENVTIFDIRGRQLASQKQIGNTQAVFTTLPTTQQVLLVKIEAENGTIVTKKVVY